MEKIGKRVFVILIILILMCGIFAWKFFIPSEEKIACTEEAKLCSDGSSVGRMAPDCNFAPCPKENLIQVESPRSNEIISSPLVIICSIQRDTAFFYSFNSKRQIGFRKRQSFGIAGER